MARSLLVGIDLGGGGARSLLLDVDTGTTTIASARWAFERVSGAHGLGFELDLAAIWNATARTVGEVLARADARPEQVVGLAVSALRFGSVVLDGDGRVRYAVPNLDARAAIEGIDLARSEGQAIVEETGLWPMPIHASARLRWLQKHLPDALSGRSTLLSLGDWLNFRLCGELATDFSQAGCTGLFQLAARRWNEERISRMSLPSTIFPRAAQSGECLGVLRKDAAQDLGLRAGTPVGLGGADTQCALLGAGALRAGDMAVVAGTTAPVQGVSCDPVIDPRGRVWSGHHVVPGAFVLESNGGPMGATLSWMSRLLYPDASVPESRLLEEAARGEPGAAGMLSTLGAEVMNARAPSMPFGQITLTHMTSGEDPNPRRHLCRAFVEGQACAVRANAEQVAEFIAHEGSPLHLTGGLSRSDVFAQILADICGVEVRATSEPVSSALGAAFCAAVAAGVSTDFVTAAARWVRTRSPHRPDPARADAYAELYQAWCRLRDAGAESTTPLAAAHITSWALRAQD